MTKPYRDDDSYPLKEWDVITHVGPHAIDNQGYVDVRDGLRMRFLYWVARLAKDGKIADDSAGWGKKGGIGTRGTAAGDRAADVAGGVSRVFHLWAAGVRAATQEYVRALGGSGIGALLVCKARC